MTSKNNTDRKPEASSSQNEHQTGVINMSYEYKKLMPALAALKLLNNPKIKDFSFDLNPSSFKKFDDLSISITYTNDKTKEFAVQLKYRDKGKDKLDAQTELCGKSHYKKKKGKQFDILEYKEAYQKEKERFSPNCKLILFTNAKFENINKMTDFSVDVTTQPDFAEDTKTSCKFKVENANKEDNIFYSKFYLLSEQQNARAIRANIEKIFKEQFHCSKDTAACYIDFFHQLQSKSYEDTKINRDQLILILAKLLLLSFIIDPPKKHTNINLIEKVFKMFDLTVLSSAEDIFITDDSAFKENLLNPPFFEKMNTLATKLKFIQNNENFTPEYILLQFVYYLENEIMFLHSTNTSEKIIAAIAPFLKTLTNRKVHLVLIAKETMKENFNTLKVFYNLGDLQEVDETLYLEMIQNLKVSLQGREAKSIKHFRDCGVNIDTMITPVEIFHSSKGEILLGEKIEKLPDNYIPRKLLRLYVKINRLKKVCLEKPTVVHCHGKSEDFKQVMPKKEDFQMISFAAYEEIKSKTSEPILILTDDNENLNNKNFNHLTFENNSLMWIDRKVDPTTSTVFKNNVSLLIDEPGTGKTTFMKFLASTCPIDYWVAFISAQAIISILERESDDETLIMNLLGATEKNNRHFEHFLKNKKVVLLFDGLNELSMDLTRTALLRIKGLANAGYKIWISSTAHLKSHFEKIFKPAYYYIIEELDEDNQKNYISKRLQPHNVTREVIEKITNQISNVDSSISKTPLNLSILIDVLREQDNEIETDFNVSQLYTKFMEGRLKHFLKSMNSNFENNQILFDVFKAFLWKVYQNAALTTCLSEDVVNSLKNAKIDKRRFQIIKKHVFSGIFKIEEDDKYNFSHETYADYFAAMWLIEYFKNVPEDKRDFIFHSKHSGIKKFMDYQLAQNCLLHLAVLNQDIQEVEKLASKHLHDLDKGGRAALHLAASLGRKHLNLNENEIIDFNQYNEDFQKQNKIFLFLLLKSENDTMLKTDLLFGWTVCQYADASMCLLFLEELNKRMTYKPTCFKNLFSLSYHCVANGYQNLLKIIINDESLQKLDEIHKRPLFHVAIENRQQDIAMFLLEHGTSINSTNLQKHTHLHVAALFGNHDIAEVLLDKNADINAKDNMKRTALHHASRMCHLNVATLLVEKGANVNSIDIDHQTPLHKAAKIGDIEIVKCLLDHDADINALTSKGNTALHRASEMGCLNVVQHLVSKKADTEIKDKFDMTALHYAAANGFQDVVEFLIKQEVNIFATDEVGNTAREIAEEKGYDEIAQVLQQAEEMYKRRSSKNTSLVHLAARIGNLPLLKENLKKGNIEDTDDYKNTVLHVASSKGHLDIVKFLLKNNANTAARNIDNRVPLHLAAQRGHTEVIRALLGKGQDYVKDKRNITPIHWAAYRGHKEAVEVFIDAGINQNQTIENGRTLLHSAAHNGHICVIEFLLLKGANAEALTEKKETCLHIAASKKQYKIVEFLIKNCRSIIDIQDRYGKTALQLAVEKNDKKSVMALLKGGAKTTVKNDCGQTAFEIACNTRHEEIAELFKNYSSNKL